ncbi:glycosyl transferase [Rhizobium sp. Root708]|uniref:glycosyltransferase n=1 Tax=Rhizobium sp. Root708 TaxID=1736592 RepID=UPI00070041EE|nr:glycosyltransferase [Rhizobium sp. Root708]KRB53082.1 glycosyl transferase [Rhizobium sp. Root708]
MLQRKLSIVAPTYNESDNIAPFIERAKEVLGQFDWEIIFVDDNSPDGTGQKTFDYSLEDRRIRAITRLSDRGLAKSSIQGLLSARGELLCVMDVDGQHDPAVINEMAERLESDKLHIVSAARRLEQDQELEGLSPIRQKLSTFGNWLSSRVLGRKLIDPLTGFFVIRRDSFIETAPHLGDPGFKLLLDILYSNKALRHAEVPFDFGVRLAGQSKLDSYVVWKFVTFLLSKMTGGLVPVSLISFLLVGGSGIFVHFAVLYFALSLLVPFTIAQTVATLIAATGNFLLNNLLTFRDRRLRGWGKFWGYLKFLTVSAVGIVANVSAATLTYERLVHVVFIATLAGIAIDTVWKFVIANRFIWK